MKTPSEHEINRLMHEYDPVARREYYLRTRKLKGRKKGSAAPTTINNRTPKSDDPRTGKTRKQISKDARSKQRKELQDSINKLQDRLNKLEALIKKRESEEASEDRKGKAKKERAAKERDKPDSAAEKAKAARENEKYRDKHKQKLKNKAKKDSDKKSGGGSSKGSSSKTKKHSVSELKSLAKKVRGQIAVAKQKLAAL